MVEHGSPEYLQALALRRRVLRHPLGLDFEDEELEAEKTDLHFAYMDGGGVLACLILVPLPEGAYKMRQVAVRSDLARKGFGRALVNASEEYVRKAGGTEINLHARDTAVPFYLRLGYEPVGEPFEEVTIPHQAMVKRF